MANLHPSNNPSNPERELEHTTPMASISPVDRIHERRDVDTSALLKGIGALVVIMVITVVVLRLMFNVFETRAEGRDVPPTPVEDTEAKPVGPHLQPSPMLDMTPREDMNRFRALEDSMLTSNGWVDSNLRIQRIPVDSAISLLVAGKGRLPGMMSSDTTGARRTDSVGAKRDSGR